VKVANNSEFADKTKASAIPVQQADTRGLAKTIRVLAFVEAVWVTGPAKNLIEFARRAGEPNLSGLRANVALATFHRGKSADSTEFIDACRDAGVELHLIQERYAFDPQVVFSMGKLIDSYKPDIVQTHAVKSHFLARISRIHNEHHWIAFHHGYVWTDRKARLYNQLDRWSLRSAQRVVTVCRPFAAALEATGVPREHISIQHNAVNEFHPVGDQKLAELRSALKIPENAVVLLNVGRLSREKGQADLIDALGIIRRNQPSRELRLLLVGTGPDGPKLRELAARSGVEDWVLLEGHQTDVAKYYTLAHMMVLPSHTEGSPNTLLEAMAAGLPIVATLVGGVPEIVRSDQEAVLVERQQPAALANAIQRVLDDREFQEKLATRARSTVAQYSPEKYCASMLALYDSCLMAGVPNMKSAKPASSVS
jgi:glycosyltransferase involved in cell wall biosynthesis